MEGLFMRSITFLLVACFVLFLTACKANDQNIENENEVTQTNNHAAETNEVEQEENMQQKQSDETQDMRERMDELPYTKFELEVEYDDHTEYEAEIKLKNNEVKAEIENELEGIEIKGPEAFDEIFPIVKELNFDRNTDKNEVIERSLDAFNLSDDYKEFELELTFDDGTEIEFEDRK